MTEPTTPFDAEELRHALADAIRRGDKRTAVSIKADLDRLAPAPDKGPQETR